MKMKDGRGLKVAVFGEEGAGKTDLLVGVARLAPTRYLYIDNEGSTTAYPLHIYTKEEPYGVYLSDPFNSGEVQKLLSAELARAAKGQGLYDAIVLDSMTDHSYNESRRIEGQFDKEFGSKGSDEKTLKRWGEVLAANVQVCQTGVALSNNHCAFMLTSAANRREDDAKIIASSTIQPLMSGSIKDLVGKWFDLVIFVEPAVEEVKGVKKPVHKYHMLRDGPWRVKNRWEEEWLRLGLPNVLTNTNLEELLPLIAKAEEERARKFQGVKHG